MGLGGDEVCHYRHNEAIAWAQVRGKRRADLSLVACGAMGHSWVAKVALLSAAHGFQEDNDAPSCEAWVVDMEALEQTHCVGFEALGQQGAFEPQADVDEMHSSADSDWTQTTKEAFFLLALSMQRRGVTSNQ